MRAGDCSKGSAATFFVSPEKDRLIAVTRKYLRRRQPDAGRAAGNEDEISCI